MHIFRFGKLKMYSQGRRSSPILMLSHRLPHRFSCSFYLILSIHVQDKTIRIWKFKFLIQLKLKYLGVTRFSRVSFAIARVVPFIKYSSQDLLYVTIGLITAIYRHRQYLVLIPIFFPFAYLLVFKASVALVLTPCNCLLHKSLASGVTFR